MPNAFLLVCLESFRYLQARCQEYRGKLVLVIVALALLLDNMLLTTIVSIFPRFLMDKNKDVTAAQQLKNSSLHDPTVETLRVHGHTTVGELRHVDPSVLPSYTGTGTYANRKELLMQHDNGECNCKCNGGPLQASFTRLDKGASANSFYMRLLMSKNPNDHGVSDARNNRTRPLPDRGEPEEPPDIPTRSPANALTAVNFTTTEASRRKLPPDNLRKEGMQLGLLYSAKPAVQLIANPFIGPLTHRIGYSIPMFTGFIILFLSTTIFAFGDSYGVLVLARGLQGVGSACSSVSGMGMLAESYPNDKERGNAMGIALGGLALGVLIGPPFGGFMSQYFNKTAPFLLLAFLALGDGLLQLLVLQPKVMQQEREAPTLKQLVQDPYILVTAGAITFANMGIGMLEPSMPLWMIYTMDSSNLEQGEAFLPASISYLLGTNLFGFLGNVIGRSLSSFLGLIISGISLICIPSATRLGELIAPMAGLGFGIGMVDSSMMPTLASLVDLRHANIYGSVYAIGDVAFCLGFFIGPVAASTLVHNIGFGPMLYGMAIINFLYAPLMYYLKNPPARAVEEETTLIVDQKPTNYINFKNEEDDE